MANLTAEERLAQLGYAGQCAQQIQESGDNLVSRLVDQIEAGGDPRATVQALELFVRAVIRDTLVRLGKLT